jgi:hypothetical protein
MMRCVPFCKRQSTWRLTPNTTVDTTHFYVEAVEKPHFNAKRNAS